jgi:hypothetical protein
MAARKRVTRRRNSGVTEAQILDLLSDAVSREMREPGRGWSWTFHHVMTAQEKTAFDLFLVRTKDPLAWEPGTTEQRFRQRVQRMAEQFKEWERGRGGRGKKNPAGELAQVGPSSFVLRFAGRSIPGKSRKALESWAKVNGVHPLKFVDERSSPRLHQGPELNPRGGRRRAPATPRQHQLKIARDTMRMHCLGARIMGGMDHPTAAALLGKPLPAGCTCRVANPSSAAAMFENWHGFEPDQVAQLDLPKIDRGPLVFLGTLRRIDYDSPKWSKARPGRRRQVSYWHRSTGKPYVLTNAAGNVVVIFDPAGKFRATAAGLVK